MTKLPLYRPLSGRRIALALIVSIALHGAAVAVASLHRSEPAAQILFDANDGTLVFVEPEAGADPAPPPDPVAPIPPAPPNDTPPLFVERALAPTAITAPPKAPLRRPSHAQSASAQNASNARVFALFAPRPEYPDEARRSRSTGDGAVRLTIDPQSGRVIETTIVRSTGRAVLDQAALAGFRRWRFRPGAPSSVQCPITYTLTGAAL